MLKGKKTYIVSIALILFGVAGVVTGNLTTEQAIYVVLNGLGFGAVRNALPKS
jgi:hypothetical protein